MSPRKRNASGNTESADSGRRSFFWKLGAGVSAAVASTTGLARTGSDAASDNAAGDELALRKLHQNYEQAMDKGQHDDVIAMFVSDAEVVFNGSAHRGLGVSRLYREQFRLAKTGRRMEPAPGFELDGAQLQDRVDVSPDRLSAKAVFPYSIQVGMPIESESSLASMARLHGEGVRTWWEGGVYDVSYVKDADSRWKIARLEYRTLSRADYRAGRSYARAIPESPLR